MAKKKAPNPFDVSIFINCPFDEKYEPLFLAMVFTVTLLGFRPRCSKEVNNDDRLRKILKLMSNCRYGIHDISRIQKTKVHGQFLPRFNMPFELGIDIALKAYGETTNHPQLKNKRLLVLERDEHRYEMFISDLKGWDVEPHNNRVGDVIAKVRHFLNEAEKGDRPLPATALIQAEYRLFRRRNLVQANMSFKDYWYTVAKFAAQRNAILGTHP